MQEDSTILLAECDDQQTLEFQYNDGQGVLRMEGTNAALRYHVNEARRLVIRFEVKNEEKVRVLHQHQMGSGEIILYRVGPRGRQARSAQEWQSFSAPGEPPKPFWKRLFGAA